jgi:hypothetical protein
MKEYRDFEFFQSQNISPLSPLDSPLYEEPSMNNSSYAYQGYVKHQQHPSCYGHDTSYQRSMSVSSLTAEPIHNVGQTFFQNHTFGLGSSPSFFHHQQNSEFSSSKVPESNQTSPWNMAHFDPSRGREYQTNSYFYPEDAPKTIQHQELSPTTSFQAYSFPSDSYKSRPEFQQYGECNTYAASTSRIFQTVNGTSYPSFSPPPFAPNHSKYMPSLPS